MGYEHPPVNRPHQAELLSSLDGLAQWCDEEGFAIEETTHDYCVIADRNGGSIWWLFRVEGWLQVKGVVFEDVDPFDALCLSLMRLHSRLLGCRFGIDEENDLLVYADLLPHDQSGGAVGAAIIQMQAIVDSTYDLLLRVQDSGIPADEAAIDEAFQLNAAPLH